MAPKAAKPHAAPPWNCSRGGPWRRTTSIPSRTRLASGRCRALSAASFAAKRAANDEAKSALLTTIRDLSLGEHAANETLAVSRDRLPDAIVSVASSPIPIMVIVVSPSCASLPQVPDGFEWTTVSWGAALRCIPLGVHAPHLFTTRQLGCRRQRTCARWPKPSELERQRWSGRCTGAGCLVIRRGSPVPDPRPEGDALISDAPGVAIAVTRRTAFRS